MIAFWGIYSVAFFGLILGYLWFSNTGLNISDALVGYIGKSIWLSWLLAVISYYTSIGSYLTELIGFLTVAILVSAICGWPRRADGIIDAPPRIWSWTALLMSSFLCATLITKGLTTFEYTLLFSGHDPFVSWNNWADQLYQGHYKPYAAAYPILFPGLWSLIYEAQGSSDIWIFAKLTTLIIPISLFILFAWALIQREWWTTIAVGTFFLFIYASRFKEATLGNMDFPVAGAIFISLFLLAKGVSLYEVGRADEFSERLLLSALWAGIATTTKQAGVLTLLPIAYTVIATGGFRRPRLPGTLIVVVAALLPMALFFVMFSDSGKPLAGNLSTLQSKSLLRAGDDPMVIFALEQMRQYVPATLIVALVVLACRNVLKLSSISGQLGCLCLLMSFLGFLLYANCCSYGGRNSVWIASLLFASAMFAWSDKSVDFAKKYYRIAMNSVLLVQVFLMLAIGAAGFFVFRDTELLRIQLDAQARIGNPWANKLLYEHKEALASPSARIITAHQPTQWLPAFEGRVVLCRHSQCVRQNLKKYPGSLVLTAVGGPKDYPDFRKSLTNRELLGREKNFLLYKPEAK